MVDFVNEYLGSKTERNFFNTWINVNFSGNTLYHGARYIKKVNYVHIIQVPVRQLQLTFRAQYILHSSKFLLWKYCFENSMCNKTQF
jgi:hypothetical protein